MSKPDWKETSINNDWDKEYYTARVHCTNNCGHMGERTIQIRKGVKRDQITDCLCDHCGWFHFGHEPVWEREAKMVVQMKPFAVREHKPRRVFLSRDEIKRLCSVSAERMRA